MKKKVKNDILNNIIDSTVDSLQRINILKAIKRYLDNDSYLSL